MEAYQQPSCDEGKNFKDLIRIACLRATMSNVDQYLKSNKDWFHGYEGEAKIDFCKVCNKVKELM